MKQWVYIDTSVVGGYFDEEFLEDTFIFIELVRNGEITIIVSDILEAELLRAPDFVKVLLQNIDKKNIEIVRLSPDSIELADKYIEAKVVGKTSRADCQHIAIATICNADVLVSWNFKHIVNVFRIRGYNAVNLKNGYIQLDIRSPKEIVYNENDN